MPFYTGDTPREGVMGDGADVTPVAGGRPWITPLEDLVVVGRVERSDRVPAEVTAPGLPLFRPSPRARSTDPRWIPQDLSSLSLSPYSYQRTLSYRYRSTPDRRETSVRTSSGSQGSTYRHPVSFLLSE